MKILYRTEVERSACSLTELFAAEGRGEPIDTSDGYVSIRIPALAVTESGRILTVCEYRAGGDWSAIDLCLRMSDDGGRTFSPRRVLVSGRGRYAVNNPALIADGGRVHFLYCENYKRVFYCRSDDGGETFSPPREITAAAEEKFPFSVIAVGPAHGAVTPDGRLIVPVWHVCDPCHIFAHHPSRLSVLIGEGGGARWHMTDAVDTGEIPDPNETAAAVLPDGRVMLSIRNESPEKRRALAFSTDGGRTFSRAVLDASLPDPVCEGSLCTGGGEIWSCNCASTAARERLTVKRWDGRRFTDGFPVDATGGYSDMGYRDGKLYVLYEAEDVRCIRLAVLAV